MDSELQDLSSSSKPQSNTNTNSNSNSNSNDKDPLLLTPPPDMDIEELEKKYAAYVRHDVYGTMGRGHLPWTEKLLLGFAFFTVLPVRVVLATLVVVLYYLICRLCTLFTAPNREDEQEDYAHLGGWRRTVLFSSGRLLSRVMLFAFGFYWIPDQVPLWWNSVF